MNDALLSVASWWGVSSAKRAAHMSPEIDLGLIQP